ncbi:MAG: hypothetical protein KatS3mg103_0860 [Phycisphaerales bacterium]|nr:MAG: hypothetical protein KatS3mg103_0860 [Phycisphaerales bacterium]
MRSGTSAHAVGGPWYSSHEAPASIWHTGASQATGKPRNRSTAWPSFCPASSATPGVHPARARRIGSGREPLGSSCTIALIVRYAATIAGSSAPLSTVSPLAWQLPAIQPASDSGNRTTRSAPRPAATSRADLRSCTRRGTPAPATPSSSSRAASSLRVSNAKGRPVAAWRSRAYWLAQAPA